MTKCPQCGRTLREHERYCDFCEQDITKEVEKKEHSQLGKDLKEVFSKLKNLFKLSNESEKGLGNSKNFQSKKEK